MNSYMKATEDNLHHGIAREMESPYLPFLGMIERSMRVSEKERFFSVAPSNESPIHRFRSYLSRARCGF